MIQKTEHKVAVLVIGGGASGMMAAARAGECGQQVILLEKNKSLGEKLKITGGGRCNITNAEYDRNVLLSNYGDRSKFLQSPFAVFGVEDTFDFFQSRGLELKVEAGKRAFPITDRALDVFLVLENCLQKNGTEIITNSPVKNIVFSKGRVEAVETATHIFYPDKVVLSTGGKSRPETGSTGDGFAWLREAGHTVAEPTPDIVPLAVKESWPKKISGVSIDDVKVYFYCGEKKEFTKRGRILATHFGLSGPMILNSAAQVRDLMHKGEVSVKIDLYPNLDAGSLDREFTALFDQNKNKALKNVLPDILPAGFMPAFRELFSEINLDNKVHSVSREDRKHMGQRLKALELTITGLLGFGRAVVSDGGVVLDEIDTRTMQSKKCSNLFVTGDLLHINRPSGGYSLQLCWTTGFVAGCAQS